MWWLVRNSSYCLLSEIILMHVISDFKALIPKATCLKASGLCLFELKCKTLKLHSHQDTLKLEIISDNFRKTFRPEKWIDFSVRNHLAWIRVETGKIFSDIFRQFLLLIVGLNLFVMNSVGFLVDIHRNSRDWVGTEKSCIWKFQDHSILFYVKDEDVRFRNFKVNTVERVTI